MTSPPIAGHDDFEIARMAYPEKYSNHQAQSHSNSEIAATDDQPNSRRRSGSEDDLYGRGRSTFYVPNRNNHEFKSYLLSGK